jgi:hypothetical protein
MPPALNAPEILEIGSFSPGKPGQQSSYFKLLMVAGMSAVYHHTQLFSVDMGSYKLFCLGWPGAMIFPISVF